MNDPDATDVTTDLREAFRLEVVSQGWLATGEYDTCSHGSIRAVIDGTVVTTTAADYGISQSALALLRTIDQDHVRAFPATGEPLLCHGCGYPFSFGCSNFGTDWNVEHAGEDVMLHGAIHYDATGGFVSHDVRVRLPREAYVREVAKFAQVSRDFYLAAEPRIVPEGEHAYHVEFWREFDARLALASRDIGRRRLRLKT
jgi:hypothetical protein